MAETVNSSDSQINWNNTRSSWFIMILYPDDDRHSSILRYVENHRVLFPSFVWILHDKDLDDSGSLKKPHIHFLYKRRDKTTVKAQLKFFEGLIDYIEPCSDYHSYIYYMLHDTIQCEREGKHLYSVLELHGDNKVIGEAIIQNANCVYFFDILQKMKDSDWGTVEEVFNWISSLPADDRSKYLEAYQKYSHILNRLSFEIDRRKADERFAASIFSREPLRDFDSGEIMPSLSRRGVRFR